MSTHAPEWRAAGGRTRLMFFDGSIIGPIVLNFVYISFWSFLILIVYAGLNAYCVYRGRSMIYFVDRWRFWLRGGVVNARPAGYWRKLLASDSARS